MVRTRRVLFFSNKVYNYLTLFSLFFFSLFLLRLWWPVTTQYEYVTSIVVVTFSTITFLYGIFNIGMIVLLLIKDHVFITSLFITDIIKIGINISIIFSVQLLMSVSMSGITISL